MAIFVTAAFVGRQHQQNKNIPKAKPVASPLVRSSFAQTTGDVGGKIEVEKSASVVLDETITRIKEAMPSKQQIRALGEQQLHHLPPSIAELSQELGAIKQLIHDNPNDGAVIGKSIAFYRSCSTQTDWATSIRALCLANLHEVAGESLDSAPVELYRLAKLAVELPES